MNSQAITQEAERLVRNAAAVLLTPRPRECLVCFMHRQVLLFGCNNSHRFALLYRSLRAPQATALLTRLSDLGACCCDCELFLNGYCLRPNLSDLRLGQADEHPPPGVGGDLLGADADTNNSGGPESASNSDSGATFPGCLGVRTGSTQPCPVWVRIPERW